MRRIAFAGLCAGLVTLVLSACAPPIPPIGGGGKGPVVGITFTSEGPSLPGTAFPQQMVNNLGKMTQAANQHLLNFGSAVGDGCKAGNGNVAGDTNWAHYDWSTLDLRVKQMQRMSSKYKILSLDAAPMWMEGLAPCDWAHVSDPAVLPQYLPAWASFVHYVVKRYQPMGVKYFAVWREMQGYWKSDGTPDFAGYTNMYNKVWDAIKSDPATARAKVGGPYAVMTQHQNGWGAPAELQGAWGAVSPSITNGYRQWARDAHGFDFVAVDYSMGDVSGNQTGNYNPKGLPFSTMVNYFGDTTRWLQQKVAGTKPIIALEAYWGQSRDLPQVLDQFNNNGGDVFLIWHSYVGVAALLVNRDGTMTDTGALLKRYVDSHPAKAL